MQVLGGSTLKPPDEDAGLQPQLLPAATKGCTRAPREMERNFVQVINFIVRFRGHTSGTQELLLTPSFQGSPLKVGIKGPL